MDERTGKNWRELCAAAVEEPDSDKLASLVSQILQAFDESDRSTQRPRSSVQQPAV